MRGKRGAVTACFLVLQNMPRVSTLFFTSTWDVRQLFRKVSGVSEWERVAGVNPGRIGNDSPGLEDLASVLHFPYWDDSLVSLRESRVQFTRSIQFSLLSTRYALSTLNVHVVIPRTLQEVSKQRRCRCGLSWLDIC